MLINIIKTRKIYQEEKHHNLCKFRSKSKDRKIMATMTQIKVKNKNRILMGKTIMLIKTNKRKKTEIKTGKKTSKNIS